MDAALVNELDARFRMVPTFGRDTIRKFSANTSEMRKMAAHNYEDILQSLTTPEFLIYSSFVQLGMG
ncbi:hypothetical protein DXG01_016105 [Tephrocybe rancida]|nr:hypothetical protein DXG01_016105 [Tephrocybe rancida]